MDSVIELKKVTKTYGSSRGVNDISLEVPSSSVFGFLGPNGAGKTTTISMLVDLIRATDGEISIFGLDSKRRSKHIRSRIGFLSSDMALDRNLTGWQVLSYYGNLRGKFNKPYIEDLAKRLESDLNKQIRSLSRGNRQKVGLISALMHEPDLLILDEPTSGLDPLIQAEFNKIIIEHQEKGGTTFISSHVLSEVQTLCDHMAFIRDGELIAVKTREDIANTATKHVRVLTGDKKLQSALLKLPGLTGITHEPDMIAFALSGDINPVLSLLGRHKVEDVTIQEADLETIFIGYYEKNSLEEKKP